jgi:hypothetical protein
MLDATDESQFERRERRVKRCPIRGTTKNQRSTPDLPQEVMEMSGLRCRNEPILARIFVVILIFELLVVSAYCIIMSVFYTLNALFLRLAFLVVPAIHVAILIVCLVSCFDLIRRRKRAKWLLIATFVPGLFLPLLWTQMGAEDPRAFEFPIAVACVSTWMLFSVLITFSLTDCGKAPGLTVRAWPRSLPERPVE